MRPPAPNQPPDVPRTGGARAVLPHVLAHTPTAVCSQTREDRSVLIGTMAHGPAPHTAHGRAHGGAHRITLQDTETERVISIIKIKWSTTLPALPASVPMRGAAKSTHRQRKPYHELLPVPCPTWNQWHHAAHCVVDVCGRLASLLCPLLLFPRTQHLTAAGFACPMSLYTMQHGRTSFKRGTARKLWNTTRTRSVVFWPKQQ